MQLKYNDWDNGAIMKKIIVLAFTAVLISAFAYAEPLRTAAGAGYKNVVEDWAVIYEKTTSQKSERIYGNMGQITAQITHGSGVCVVIGDKAYLSKTDLPISVFYEIGVGRPTLVTKAGLKAEKVADLKKAEFKKIAAPDFNKAIYGKAAYQILKSGGYDDILSKVMEAGTVPRSGAYTISGETDASFINLTFAIANKSKFGSVTELTEGFEPIEISAGVLNGCEDNENVKTFIGLLDSVEMKNVVKKYGL